MDQKEIASSPGAPPAKPGCGMVIAFLFFLGLLTFVSGEVLFRIFLKKQLYIETSERNLLYRFDESLGWFPRERSTYTFGDYGIRVYHNRFGFRDPEYDLPKSGPRIAIFGDSFTWGYNLAEEERFGNLLQAKLRGVEILNFGVSGFGNDQQLLLMREMLPKVSPDIVVLLFCTINDRDENQHNKTHGGYYKPYLVEQDGRLDVRGVPVPRSQWFYYGRFPKLFGRVYWMRVLSRVYESVFLPARVTVPDITEMIIDEMKSECEARGATFVIGFEDRDEALMDHCKTKGIPFVDLGNRERFPGPSAHWNQAGNRIVADRLEEFLEPMLRPTAGSKAPPPSQTLRPASPD